MSVGRFRKNSPQLQAAATDFYNEFAQKAGVSSTIGSHSS